MLAIVVGPFGIGIYSILTNILNLFNSAFPLGAIGLNKYFSEFYESKKTGEINYLLKRFLIINLYLIIPIVFIFIFFAVEISNILFSDPKYSVLIIILACTFPFSVLTGFIDIYLRGIRKINNYVFFIVINSILAVILFIPLQMYFGLTGVFISLLIVGVLSVLNGVLILKRIDLFPDLFKTIAVEDAVTKNILKFGIGSIVMLASLQLSLLAVRLFIISKYSIVENGIFQSVFSISNNYFGFFFQIIGAYGLPKLASFGSDTDKMKVETNNLLKLFLLLFTPPILCIFILRDYALITLYSREFLGASNLFGFQLSGDFFKAISWSLALWLIPCLKFKQWLLFDLIYSVNFFVIFYLFQIFTDLGIISISISYLLSNFINFVLNFIFIKKTINFKFAPDVYRIMIYSGSFIAFVFLIDLVLPKGYNFFLLIFPALFVYLNFKKDDFNKLILLFSKKDKS